MFRRSSSRRSSQGSPQELNWAEIEDPDCVAEPGWDTDPKRSWTCTTCKKYVKMKHLAKLWPRSQAQISVPRWEGPTSNCASDHFRERYYEVHNAVGLPNSKPTMMNYSTMAMVWAEIVLHKDVDWRTVYGRNVETLNRSQHMIPTNWSGPSDCMPLWSNRRSNETTSVVDDVDTSQWEVRQRNVENYPVTFGAPHSEEFHNYHETPTPRVRGEQGRSRHGYDDNEYGFNNDERPSYSDTYSTPQSYFSENDFRTHGIQGYTPTNYERGESSSNNAPVSFGRDRCSAANVPPPTFAAGPSTRYNEDDEYERNIQEAMRRSQEEENARMQIEQRFFDQQWDSVHGTFRSSPRRPSRRY